MQLPHLGYDNIDFLLFNHIVARGKLMQNDDDEIYDSLKSTLEQEVEPAIQKLILKSYKEDNFRQVILLAEAMLNIDSISDFAILYFIHAMEQLDKSSEARKRFFQFMIEYKKMIGEEYPKDYTTILDKKP